MNAIFIKIATLIATPIFLLAGWIAPQPEPIIEIVEPELGAISFVGGKNYSLYGGGIGSTDTSITLSSFTIPVSGTALTMSNFGDVGYLTIEPGSATRQEFVSFTGITQNGDGTATITGVTRGLQPISPYTTSSTYKKAHPGGSIVVISNPPQLYDEAAFKDNNEDIVGLWTFNTVLPTTSITATTSQQLINKAYADALAVQGSPTSTESLGGIVELATEIEVASSTPTTSNKPLVVQAQNATSTPVYSCDDSGTAGALCIPVAENDGKLNQSWLDLTEQFTFASSTITTFQSTNSTTTNQYITSVTSSLLKTDSAGQVTSATLGTDYDRAPLLATGGFLTTSGTATSTHRVTVPAGTMSTTGLIEIQTEFTKTGGNGQEIFAINIGSGTATSSPYYAQTNTNGSPVKFNFQIGNNSSLSSQFFSGTSATSTATNINHYSGTTAINTANQFYIEISARKLDASDSMIIRWAKVLLHQQ